VGMDLDVAEVHEYTKKDKLLKAKFTHLDQTRMANEGFIWLKGYFCGTQRVI